MHSDDPTNESVNYSDDTRVLRYLLHNIKGISAVSGGVMGDALEQEYEAAEEEVAPEEYFDTQV